MYSLIYRFIGCCALLWLPSCSITSGWPPPAKLGPAGDTTAGRLSQAVEVAQAAETRGPDEALERWLALASQAAHLIEDRTSCGDGSLSRVKVTRTYQHALGRVLASSASPAIRSHLDVQVVQQGGLVRASLSSVKPAPTVREYGGLRVGVPVDVDFAVGTRVPGGRYVGVLLFPSPAGRPVLELRPTQADSTIRLVPGGPMVPLREAALR